MLQQKFFIKFVIAVIFLFLILISNASATIFNVVVDGSDAIFLAGRTDVEPIPPLNGNSSAFILVRHGYITPEAIVETLPPYIPVSAGDVIRVLDPAIGGVSFYNGLGGLTFGPSGNGLSGSNLTSLGGISGYIGPQGPLTGVFLTDSIPSSGPAPSTLDFSGSGLGIDFASLSPLLGQIFYIGDGLTISDDFQTFIAPTGATRLFLGIPDGFGFVGAPGAYDDNDGFYSVKVGINEIPSEVPEPATILILGSGLIALTGCSRRKLKK
jgi:hypothetical protein